MPFCRPFLHAPYLGDFATNVHGFSETTVSCRHIFAGLTVVRHTVVARARKLQAALLPYCCG